MLQVTKKANKKHLPIGTSFATYLYIITWCNSIWEIISIFMRNFIGLSWFPLLIYQQTEAIYNTQYHISLYKIILVIIEKNCTAHTLKFCRLTT